MDQRRVLIISTSHATKGSTGQKTGAYLPEISHPVDAFTAAGLAVTIGAQSERILKSPIVVSVFVIVLVLCLWGAWKFAKRSLRRP